MVSPNHNAEFYLTIIAVPVTILILLCGALFVRKETTSGMIVIIVSLPAQKKIGFSVSNQATQMLFFAAMAYFCFKLYRMYAVATRNEYLPARASMTFFAIITLILIVVTIINACMCVNNFHCGLKPHITTKKAKPEEKTTELSSNMAGTTVPSRMMID